MTALLTHFSFSQVPCDSKSIHSLNSPDTINTIHHGWIRLQGPRNACLECQVHWPPKLKTSRCAKIHSYIFNTCILLTLLIKKIVKARGNHERQLAGSEQRTSRKDLTQPDFWICLMWFMVLISRNLGNLKNIIEGHTFLLNISGSFVAFDNIHKLK